MSLLLRKVSSLRAARNRRTFRQGVARERVYIRIGTASDHQSGRLVMLEHREGWGMTYPIIAVQAFVTPHTLRLKVKNSACVGYRREVMR